MNLNKIYTVFKVIRFTIILYLFLLSTCFYQNRIVQINETRLLMGTVVEITVLDTSEVAAKTAITDAFDEISRISAVFYEGNPKSPIYAFNHRTQNEIVMPSEVLGLVERSMDISKKMDGAFDITVGGLLPLYRFKGDSLVPPNQKDIQAVLPFVGFNHLVINFAENILSCNNRKTQIGTGAVAKGYAVDRAIELLNSRGVKGAIINAGGDLRVLPRMDGKRWRVGIQHPRNRGEMLDVLEICNGAITTSGDYEKFFMYQEKRIHHILDPKTGLPADSCQSVTIIAPKAELADALATGMFVLGITKGMEFIQQFPEVEAMWIRTDGKRFETSGFGKYYADK
ncbi:MAG: hypothetical protein COT43_06145 [Candidatus Marinimicrobia bacterium CG08_land_8_20_14_0_20_45_22]|nr:MAG: hypothetical protein COT43_06145 [Candidatus Marinimicrobia bacterium CG08_land_8_20_14_0_20_45_22]